MKDFSSTEQDNAHLFQVILLGTHIFFGPSIYSIYLCLLHFIAAPSICSLLSRYQAMHCICCCEMETIASTTNEIIYFAPCPIPKVHCSMVMGAYANDLCYHFSEFVEMLWITSFEIVALIESSDVLLASFQFFNCKRFDKICLASG